MNLTHFLLLLLLHLQPTLQRCKRSITKPHIIVIIADDMGHNDIGLRGSSQIPTPNIDALGYNGVILNKFYVQNACTPSRAAFLTGNYPIRSGMQGRPIVAGQNRSIPANMGMMQDYFKQLGYKTHLVGKWHLGAAYRSSTPTRRGFDTHYGYWNGFISYFDYYTNWNHTGIEGFDLRDGFSYDWSKKGHYATSVFTDKALDIIDRHDRSNPLFLTVAHLAAHTGLDGIELGVPNKTFTNTKFHYIQEENRRLYTDVVYQLDLSVGKIIKKLSEKKLLKNSIILFFSDNGAPSVGPYSNSGSNWPLRGIKMTNFEGGIRGTGVIFSPLLKKRGYVNDHLIHISDWLPTLYTAAGGDITNLGVIDGINQWETLSRNLPTNRDEFLVNVNEYENTTGYISHGGKFKLLTGTFMSGDMEAYFGESGRGVEVPTYNFVEVMKSDTNIAIQGIVAKPITIEQMESTRQRINLAGCRDAKIAFPMNCSNACLFNLEQDPCETTNIIEEQPEIAEVLLGKINEFRKVLVPQVEEVLNPNANPQRYNNTWCTWLDDDWCFKTPNNTRLY